MGDLRGRSEAGDDILGRHAQAAGGGEGKRDVAALMQAEQRRAQRV